MTMHCRWFYLTAIAYVSQLRQLWKTRVDICSGLRWELLRKLAIILCSSIFLWKEKPGQWLWEKLGIVT